MVGNRKVTNMEEREWYERLTYGEPTYKPYDEDRRRAKEARAARQRAPPLARRSGPDTGGDVMPGISTPIRAGTDHEDWKPKPGKERYPDRW
ncbi:MAG TPA: hypothetical protein VM889_14380 [Candidatus Thermoplasmatota archaeon]|nr:hypothetical protein [Candidatus Thermoplasmatota archaeon]